jgi:hypothetical protein
MIRFIDRERQSVFKSVKAYLLGYATRVLRRTANALPFGEIKYHVDKLPVGRPRVLICGVYVADKENRAIHLVERFAEANLLDVTQRWCCMRGTPPSPEVARATKMIIPNYRPKWTVMGELISDDWEDFDFVVFCDDDIDVGKGFLEAFIALQQHFDFALAQPARTIRSYVAWPITRRRIFGRARQTNFVESGPFVSMDKRFLPLALPFSELSPMGWGYDHVWPLLAKQAGLKLGIIDAVCIDHRMRPQSALYDTRSELATMIKFLDKTPHMPRASLVTI